ncbi:MAG: efflux RND transporter periplasmic adaptor subunit [Bacteroidales bacterium]|nr:efflux RND transporter periplasmic adaptor subunit [Acholeplasmataceae bacterium]MCK9449239.1 efflux RND transporter periplasmic adaptor subunit [Bacteroidales bacterium]
MKINVLLFLCLSGIWMLTGCRHKEIKHGNIPTIKTEAAVIYGEVKTSSFPGKVKAASEINLSFRISGPITKINVTEGQYVKKGQIVAEIDSRDYAIQLSATEAEYSQIKAEADRIILLHGKQSVSDNDYDKAVTGLQQITAKYDAAKNALTDTKLRAPFDGYIQKRYHDKAEVISEGMPVFSMISDDLPEVEINIPAGEFIKRDKFDLYECYFDVFPEQVFLLEQISINEKANVNQLYTMRFRLKKDSSMRMPSPGMSAMVTIKYKPEQNQNISIPTTAMRDTENGTMVWVYDEITQTVQERKVTVIQILNDGKIIISQGLDVGEKVVTAGVHSLSEGEKVKLISDVSSTNVGGLL